MTLFWGPVHRYGSELPIVDDGTITTCGPLSPSSRRWAMKAMVWMVLPSPWLINRTEWIILHSPIKQSIKTLNQINSLIKLMRESEDRVWENYWQYHFIGQDSIQLLRVHDAEPVQPNHLKGLQLTAVGEEAVYCIYKLYGGHLLIKLTAGGKRSCSQFTYLHVVLL